MDPVFSLVIPVALMFLLLAMGMPIGFVLLTIGFVGMCLLRPFPVALQTLSTMPYSATANYILAVIPLFILTGQLAGAAGVSKRAYDLAYSWLGRLPGGLAAASVGACAAFAATSGSTVATAATVGRIAIPEMERFGYDSGFARGVVAAGGCLGVMIPPSTSMVIYGVVTEQPVGYLLMAGLFPGILQTIIFMIGIACYALLRPKKAPRGEAFSWKDKIRLLPAAIPIGLLFIIIVGGIYTGIFTPSEAGAYGAFAALIIAIVMGARAKELWTAFVDTGRVTAMVFLILMGGFLFSRYIVLTGTVGSVSIWLAELDVNRYIILMGIMLLYIVLGMFLDTISMLLVTIPFVFPAIVSLGFNPIWFGVIYTLQVEIGNITPPVGVNVYVIRGIAPHVSLEAIFKGIGMFVFLELMLMVILVAFPMISLWLPFKMMK